MNKDSSIKKDEHIKICLKNNIEYKGITTGFEKYNFIYQALPEIDKDKVNLSTRFLGKKLSAPLIISPMVGGTKFAQKINRRLAEAAQRYNIAFGVGSQRIAIENPSLKNLFWVRDVAPSVFLLANFGAVQLNYGFGLNECIKVITMIQADALALHLNPLQELLQKGGNINFSNLVLKIKHICSELSEPVIIKETGHGISSEAAKKLRKTGIVAIDVAGAGGTSWTLVEKFRTKSIAVRKLADKLGSLAIPTASSLLMVKEAAPKLKIIASGGIRCGLDMAKAIALGADLVGVARPFLKAAVYSSEAVYELIELLLEELRSTMFAVGAKNVEELKRKAKKLLIEI